MISSSDRDSGEVTTKTGKHITWERRSGGMYLFCDGKFVAEAKINAQTSWDLDCNITNEVLDLH